MEKEYQIPYTKSFESEVGEMCNLGEGIYLDGMKKQACDIADRMIADGDRFTDEDIARYTGIDADEVRERRKAANGVLQPA